MQKNLIIILTLLAASISCQQQSTTKGCLYWSKTRGVCTACYRRLRVPKGRCGPLLPFADYCLIHTGSPGAKSRCGLCRPGYGITTRGACAPLDIFDCVQGEFKHQGKGFCVACGSGNVPSEDGSSYIPAPERFLNCLWGGRDPASGALYCARCSPNYLKYDTDRCARQKYPRKGCLEIQEEGLKCLSCDVFAGYSMQKDGSCKFVKR